MRAIGAGRRRQGEQGGVFCLKILFNTCPFRILERAPIEQEFRDVAVEEALCEWRFAAVRVVAGAEHEGVAFQQPGLAIPRAQRSAIEVEPDLLRTGLVDEQEGVPFAEQGRRAVPERYHAAEAGAFGVEEG